jgi:hypothetical protein
MAPWALFSGREPRPHAPHGFLRFAFGNGETYPHEAVPIDGIEIYSWSRRHTGIKEQGLAEIQTIIREMRNTDVDVESAIRGRNCRQPERREGL